MSDEQTVHYLTPVSLENLNKEKDEVENKTIPDIAERIDEAKQQGDLSENAEYHQAREDMSWAQGRLAEIERILQNVQIFKAKSGQDEVALGSTAVVKINGKEKEYTVVGPQEADPAKGYISNESPLGEALLGKSKGDKIKVTTPAGEQIYEIVKIK